jgi:hypothetical protein
MKTHARPLVESVGWSVKDRQQPKRPQPKPQIGESRTHLVTSADWKAHHRSTTILLDL